MLRVIRGLPIDGRGERLLAEALSGDASGYLHVVRTRARERQLHELHRVRRGPACGARVGARVVRLSDFVERTASRRTHLRAQLGAAEREILLDELARGEARPPLRGVAGLSTWLGSFFSRLKQGDVFTAARAIEVFRSLDRDDPGTGEALRLFGLYQGRLVDLGLFDEDGLYLELARDLGTAELPFDRIMPGRRLLVVEGFYQTNVVERAIFARLFAAFDETAWLIDLASGVAPDAFGAGVLADQVLGQASVPGDLSWLRGLGAIDHDEAPVAPPRPEVEHQGDLFAPPPAPAILAEPVEAPPADPGRDWFWSGEIAARTEIAVAPDERTEARFLAERAAALVLADSAASVVIAFPSDREAAALLREACADVDLPLEVSALRSLAEFPVARALLRLLELAARDFPRDRVVAALRAARGGVDLGDVRLSASLVDRVSRKAGVIAGADEWRRKLARLRERIASELAAASSDEDRERLEREEREAGEVQRGIEVLIEVIPDKGSACTFRGFVAAAHALIARFRLDALDEVPAAAPSPESTEALATSARARRAIDTLLGVYERSDVLTRSRERSWSDHVSALRTLVASTVVPPAPALRRGAALIGARELRGLVTDHLLVGGLTEDAFPGRTELPPLLDEPDAARAGARTAEARRREAEHLLVHALRSPRRSLVLSRPRQRDGCDALPALPLEILRERFALREVRADEELVSRNALGRMTRGRLAARAITGEVRTQEAARLLESVVDAGPGAALAWDRLRAERERILPDRVGRFEGMLEAAALPLLFETPGRFVMSPTRFEDYAKCPQFYFFKRVLKLGPPEDADPDVTPLERGSVLHRILYRYHAGIAAGAPRRDRAAALDRIAREELRLVKSDGLLGEVFAETLLRDLGTEGPTARPGLLRAYLDHEERRASKFTPAVLEARFGPSRHGGAETRLSEEPLPLIEVDVDGRRAEVLVTGSIDRVDVEAVGGEVHALVLDYKSGQVESGRRKNYRGMMFQLPLYAHVVPRLLGPRFPGKTVRAIGAAYYRLKSPKELGLAEPLVDRSDLDRLIPGSGMKVLPDGEFARLLEGTVGRAGEVVAALLRGVFHPTAATSFRVPCEACDFRDVCRGAGEGPRIRRMADASLFPQEVMLVNEGDADDDDGGEEA